MPQPAKNHWILPDSKPVVTYCGKPVTDKILAVDASVKLRPHQICQSCVDARDGSKVFFGRRA